MTLNSSTPDYEQTMTTSMTTKKTAALATRGLDSFRMFQSKEFVSGYQNLVTIQPLNKSKVRGWFIRKSDLDTCGWLATEDQFAKGSVIWDYKQTFGMAPNTSVEEGLNFTEPRIQILLRSPLMVEETTGKFWGHVTNSSLRVEQFNRKGEVVMTYLLIGAFPKEVASMELGYDQYDTISEFQVTFAYQYFQANHTGKINQGGKI